MSVGWRQIHGHASRPRRGGAELLVLIGLASALYGGRLTALSLRGEESRHARMGFEMLHSGDWVVPRQQGQPYLGRPPLGSWLIALTALGTGSLDARSVRLPSALATVCVTLLVYVYARSFLTRLGAFSAGIAYATMAQVLELGGRAESEAVFTLCVSGSLLLWHLGYTQPWHRAQTWAVGYGCAALAALTKGLQGPVYFAGSAVLFLAVQRDWRMLFSRAHALGLLIFAFLVGAWQVPFEHSLGLGATGEVWMGHVARSIHDHDALSFTQHLANYPLEVLACMLPWSPLLVGLAFAPIRRSDATGCQIRFLLIALSIAFPTCWLVPGARGRYFMPLYPCAAVLTGLVVQRCAAAETGTPAARIWRGFLALAAAFMAAAGLAAVIALLARPPLARWAQPPLATAAYVLLAATLAASTVWARRRRADAWRAAAAVLAIGVFTGFTYAGPWTDKLQRESVDTAGAVAAVKARLPPGAALASFGPVHHLFAFYYEVPIGLLAWSEAADLQEQAYFCFTRSAGSVPRIPFAWQEIAAVSVTRSRYREATDVVVGQRVAEHAPPSRAEQPEPRL